MDMMRAVLVPINRDGWRFIAIFAVVSLVLFAFSPVLGWLGVLATVWCVFFFRDPPRVTPSRDGLVVSPADGLVQMIEPAVPPPELGMGNDPRMRISIFLNVFDVHVNRIPAHGRIVRLCYRPGKFMNAAFDKASELNERQSARLRMSSGQEIAFVQIAGLIARRIVCDLAEGQTVRAGERFGLIRFGSRCDVYLDEGMAPFVAIGQRMVAGETVLADATSSEPRRVAEEI